MICPKCGAHLKVVDSRMTKDLRKRGRIRRCPNHPEVTMRTVELEATDPAAVDRLMWRARERSRTKHTHPQVVAEAT